MADDDQKHNRLITMTAIAQMAANAKADSEKEVAGQVLKRLIDAVENGWIANLPWGDKAIESLKPYVSKRLKEAEKQIADETKDPGSELYGVGDELSKLITLLYDRAQKEKDKDTISQCLDLWTTGRASGAGVQDGGFIVLPPECCRKQRSDHRLTRPALAADHTDKPRFPAGNAYPFPVLWHADAMRKNAGIPFTYAVRQPSIINLFYSYRINHYLTLLYSLTIIYTFFRTGVPARWQRTLEIYLQ